MLEVPFTRSCDFSEFCVLSVHVHTWTVPHPSMPYYSYGPTYICHPPRRRWRTSCASPAAPGRCRWSYSGQDTWDSIQTQVTSQDTWDSIHTQVRIPETLFTLRSGYLRLYSYSGQDTWDSIHTQVRIPETVFILRSGYWDSIHTQVRILGTAFTLQFSDLFLRLQIVCPL